jgi:hypothetical protein
VSFEQIRRAFATPCRGPSQKLLLLVLADYADDTGASIYPSQVTLAARAQLDVRSVRRYLSQFLEDGLLRIVKPALGRSPAEYFLSLDAGLLPGQAARTIRPPGETSGQQMSVDRTNGASTPDATPAHPLKNPSEPPDRSAGARATEGRTPAWNGRGEEPEQHRHERILREMTARRQTAEAPALPVPNAPRFPLPNRPDLAALENVAPVAPANPPGQTSPAKPILTDAARLEIIARRRREAAAIAAAQVKPVDTGKG